MYILFLLNYNFVTSSFLVTNINFGSILFYVYTHRYILGQQWTTRMPKNGWRCWKNEVIATHRNLSFTAYWY